MSGLHQPKIEAEVAFVLGRDIDMPNQTPIDVINAVDYALHAVEIVGSSIANWNIRLVDTVSDNALSSAFVLGSSPKSLEELELRSCRMTISRNDEAKVPRSLSPKHNSNLSCWGELPPGWNIDSGRRLVEQALALWPEQAKPLIQQWQQQISISALSGDAMNDGHEGMLKLKEMTAR